MDRKRVLVTGANGYIGRHVVNALLEKDCEVLASDFAFDGLDEKVVKIDVPIFNKDKDIYSKLGKPDVCIHMAWRNGFVHNADSHIQDLADHYQFLKDMLAGGLPQIVVMGSMHEVGYWEGAITEDSPCNPSSLYGISKNALRQMLQLLTKDQVVIMQWIRAYYILGDDLKNSSIFSKLTMAEKEGKEIFPFTSGKNLYDFIRVNQLAEQIASVSLQKEVNGVINCCTGKPVSLADKVEEYIKDNHFNIKLQYGAFPDRPYDSPGVWGDPEKINKIMKN